MLPVWLAWVAFVLGVVALAGPIGFFVFVVSGLWFLVWPSSCTNTTKLFPCKSLQARVLGALMPSDTDTGRYITCLKDPELA